MKSELTNKILTPESWQDYELIDCGNFEKLERFGEIILARPEPQAIWDKTLSEKQWTDRLHSRFLLDIQNSNGEKGIWKNLKKTPNSWNIKYAYKTMNLRFILKFNTFKHIGIFPEQAPNWDFIFDSIKSLNIKEPLILNLFAYTGGASLAASSAGARVYHVDSVKQVINHANENAELSELSKIHWIVEDAMKFVKRQVNKGVKYDGIILDPPAFGRGPNGEKWILEKHLNEIIKDCSKILKTEKSFLILNLYSLGWSPVLAENLIKQNFDFNELEFGELVINDSFDKKLPLGIYARFLR